MSKRIILCADGTWNTPRTDPLNYPKIQTFGSSICSRADNPSQLKYYDSGVGTDGTSLEHFFGGTMGETAFFEKIHKTAYAFLSYVWDPGDDIFLFGV